jgi:hypothetical protein
MSIEWLRKNGFIRELRQYLKRFRIVDVQKEVYQEMKVVQPPESQIGGPNLFGQATYEPTGRIVIQIRLTGFWRQR